MNTVQQAGYLPESPALAIPSVRRRSRYFQGMSILLFVIVLTGFSRTFFLRSMFPVPSLTPHVYVHAVLMTAWFALLVIQTSLVARHRTDLHRRLGVFGAVLAVAVAGVTLVAALGLPAHFKVDPVPNGIPMSFDGMIQVTWGTFGSLALFCIFVTTAIWLRGRPEVHKRLLLLASLAMITPAIGRYVAYLGMWRAVTSVPMVPQMLLILVGITAVVLPLTLVVHDLRSGRGVHPTTGWGVAAFFVVGLGCQFGISSTAAGRALIIALQH
ncbi:MAG TPA: hypothetical protein VGM97_10620 [Steroidobacteraceae bacterium]|jgi:hypothetical protein